MQLPLGGRYYISEKFRQQARSSRFARNESYTQRTARSKAATMILAPRRFNLALVWISFANDSGGYKELQVVKVSERAGILACNASEASNWSSQSQAGMLRSFPVTVLEASQVPRKSQSHRLPGFRTVGFSARYRRRSQVSSY